MCHGKKGSAGHTSAEIDDWREGEEFGGIGV